MSSGGFKPLGPSKIPMDTSKAMAILGFPSSQGFENTEMAEVQSAFMKKVQKFEQITKSGNPRIFNNKRNELRRVNEAYQYLVRKRRRLTGRAMTDNWQLVGGKSNKAIDIIASLRGMTKAAHASDTDDFDAKKRADIELRRQMENDSEAAKALAAELVASAGKSATILNSFAYVVLSIICAQLG